jgi:hypothetical protein
MPFSTLAYAGRDKLTFMPQPSPADRRWFQYSLRTLFIIVTVFAVWLGWELSIIRVG